MIRFELTARPGAHQAVLDDLDRMAHVFDLDDPATDLGTRVMDAAVDGIMWNMIQEQDPDGLPWPDLSPEYEARKGVLRPGKPMAVYDGIMRTIAQLSGVRVVHTHDATMTYGTDPVAREHAAKFQEGGLVAGNPNQPPRPFYGLTRGAIHDIDAIFTAQFATI